MNATDGAAIGCGRGVWGGWLGWLLEEGVLGGCHGVRGLEHGSFDGGLHACQFRPKSGWDLEVVLRGALMLHPTVRM